MATEQVGYQSKWERRWNALKSGDPLAWGVVIVTLAIVFGWPLVKKMMSKDSPAGSNERG